MKGSFPFALVIIQKGTHKSEISKTTNENGAGKRDRLKNVTRSRKIFGFGKFILATDPPDFVFPKNGSDVSSES